MLRPVFLLPVALLIFFCSCTKDELTRPVGTALKLHIINETGNELEPIQVEGGRISISEFIFNGDRQEGEDYRFNRPFSDTLYINFNKEALTHVLDFEMPKGVYERIDLSINLAACEKIDLNTIYDTKGGIELWGTYLDVHNNNVPFIFVYTAETELNFTASTESGDQQISILDKDRQQAVIHFDPHQWLQLVNARMFESAKLSQVNGQPTIIISEYQNNNIYKLLANRIDSSAKLHFQ